MALNLSPDLEAQIQAMAAAHGESIETFLKRMVEASSPPSEGPARLSSDEFGRQLEEWADGFPDAAPIPDEALKRENLYPDRW